MSFEQVKSDENRQGFCFDTLLKLLRDGPVWDGDIPSKSGRDDLIDHGCAVRVINKGRDSFTAATYKGSELFVSHMGSKSLREALDLQHERFLVGWRERNPEAAARGELPA